MVPAGGVPGNGLPGPETDQIHRRRLFDALHIEGCHERAGVVDLQLFQGVFRPDKFALQVELEGRLAGASLERLCRHLTDARSAAGPDLREGIAASLGLSCTE